MPPIDRLNKHPGIKTAVLFTGLLTTCILFKYTLFPAAHSYNFLALNALFLVIAIVLYKIPYPDNQRPSNILIKGISVMLGVYSFLNYQAYSVDNQALRLSYDLIRFATLVCAGLSLWRPSFALMPILYTVWRKTLDTEHTGLILSPTDYMPVVEVCLLILTGHIAIFVYQTLNLVSDKQRGTLYIWTLIAAIGIHFGNYFHSALAKLMLDGGPTSWVLENQTQHLIANALESGLLPITLLPVLTQTIYDILASNYININLITIESQAACIFFISTPKRIIFITLIYDLMHIAIFLLTGIFFWKWIILNILIVTAMTNQKDVHFSPATKSIGIIFSLSGILFFFTAQLGWYDTRALKHTYITATTSTGERHIAPTNYFMNTSVTFTQGRLLPNWNGHFAFANSLGSTSSYQVMKLHNQCTPLILKANTPINFSTLGDYISRHHTYIMTRTNEQGLFNYDLFPHHVWSNPLISKNFSKLDKSKIESYTIHVESKCISMQDGKTKKEIIASSTSKPIYVIDAQKKNLNHHL